MLKYIDASGMVPLSEKQERKIREAIREVAQEKYGVRLSVEKGGIDVRGRLRDGRQLRIEHEYNRQDPIANVAKAWRQAHEEWEQSHRKKEFVLIHVFSSEYKSNGAPYKNATFVGQQMVMWGEREGLRIVYFPIQYDNVNIECIRDKIREKLPQVWI